MAKAMITRTELERLVPNELVGVLEEIHALREAVKGRDATLADEKRRRITGSSAGIHDLMVLADKLEAAAAEIKGAVSYATMETLKDPDLMESGIDGIAVQQGAKRYTFNGESKYRFLSEVSQETGVVPEYLMEACDFTLKKLSDKVGMTQEAFLERFGNFEMTRNKPTIKRTW